MYKVYHNNKCSTSRKSLEYLDNKSLKYDIREYLKEPLSEEEIRELLTQLDLKPIDIIRTKESIWKENYANKKLTDEELISIISKNPILIERPIVVHNGKAVIARPIENIDKL